jgi:FMN-dependent NADH-azoreductase
MFDLTEPTEVFVPTLLHIDSSPLYGTSVTRELSAAFVNDWKAVNPDSSVLERDLTATSIAPIDVKWIGAAYTPEEVRSSEQNEILALSNSLVAELEHATEYVIGIPMHNFSVPSVLKLWIDQIARVNRTFIFADGKPKGLLVGKKATILIATGQTYDAHTPMASLNFVEPYLRSILGFLGVTDPYVLTAGGAGALNRGQDRTTFLAPHLQAVKAHVQALAVMP